MEETGREGEDRKLKTWILVTTQKNDVETISQLTELLARLGVKRTTRETKMVPALGGLQISTIAIEVIANEIWIDNLAYRYRHGETKKWIEMENGGDQAELAVAMEQVAKFILPQGIPAPGNIGEEMQMRSCIQKQVGKEFRIRYFGPYGTSPKPKEFVIFRRRSPDSSNNGRKKNGICTISIPLGTGILHIAPTWRKQLYGGPKTAITASREADAPSVVHAEGRGLAQRCGFPPASSPFSTELEGALATFVSAAADFAAAAAAVALCAAAEATTVPAVTHVCGRPTCAATAAVRVRAALTDLTAPAAAAAAAAANAAAAAAAAVAPEVDKPEAAPPPPPARAPPHPLLPPRPRALPTQRSQWLPARALLPLLSPLRPVLPRSA